LLIMMVMMMTVIITMQTANNSMRQQNTSHHKAQCWQKNSTQRDTIQCVLNYTLIYARQQGYNYTTSNGTTTHRQQAKQVMKVRLPYCETNQCEQTEMFLTINRTSQSVTINKDRACQQMVQILETEM
jgi:hypothetical protein